MKKIFFSEAAARNMSWQCILSGEKGEITKVQEITGWDLLGRAGKNKH